MPRPKKSTSPLTDPLFAAMLARLPPVGKAWDTDKQVKWVMMLAHGLQEVYGGDLAEKLACGCHEPQTAPVVQPSASVGQPAAAPAKFQRNGAANGAAEPAPEPEAKPIPYPFYIDLEGYARNKKGIRVLASDVSDSIADMRGEDGFAQGVIWADDSQGWPRDRHLDVTLG